jgi:hypothetical protein
MELTRKLSRRVILWIVAWFMVLGISLVLLGYWEMTQIQISLKGYPEETLSSASLQVIENAARDATRTLWPKLAGVLAVVGFLLWLSVHLTLNRLVGARELQGPRPLDRERPKVRPQPAPERESSLQEDRRRSLHLLSLLQRESRLLDFLEENLSNYDDAQIGAAVRSIQESCQKALRKYVDPKAVIDQNESEEITVPAGFDPSAIKLTGNVSGAPPFRGILQHRGWRAGALNLPVLSGSVDPDIISPAEVEIPA